ncbi:hypothetical protein M5K25_022973 [Dendrobium thyrsiflorum]|uniref:Uncharacterized protein n=1 Tax=Dendrobium thyrsiflorum TaxID=117978 RepID=A0ABD0U765_DENTH
MVVGNSSIRVKILSLSTQRAGKKGDKQGLDLSADVKPRIKWTHQLNERFIEAVNKLGDADKAKTESIMRIMGFPGLNMYHLKTLAGIFPPSLTINFASN